MRKTVIQVVAAIAVSCSALLWFFTGCSKAPETPPKEVTIQADDKMRYDVTAFDAAPGQKISVTIKNIGTTPNSYADRRKMNNLNERKNGKSFFPSGAGFSCTTCRTGGPQLP